MFLKQIFRRIDFAMKESSSDDGNEKSKKINDSLNDINMTNYQKVELSKEGESQNIASALKQLVKYDRDLFEIFNKIEIKKGHSSQSNENNSFTDKNNDCEDIKDNDNVTQNNFAQGGNLNLKSGSKIVPTVEEKIDYIVGLYENNPDLASQEMSYSVGYAIEFIFCVLSEIAKGEDDFGGELAKVLLFCAQQIEEMRAIGLGDNFMKILENYNSKMNEMKELLINSSNNNHSSFHSVNLCDKLARDNALLQLQEEIKNLGNIKQKLENLYKNTIQDIKKIFGVKDEQFAITNRTFLGYIASFLKNIFLDLTFIYPVYKIFLFVSRFNNLETKETATVGGVPDTDEEKLMLQKNVADIQLMYQLMYQIMYCNKLEQILKKNNIWLLILNAIICCAPTILLILSLSFAWGIILDCIFIIALLALILYKSVERYRQERRKYFATQASQFLQIPQNLELKLVERHLSLHKAKRILSNKKNNIIVYIDKCISQSEDEIKKFEQIAQDKKEPSVEKQQGTDLQQ